MTHRATNPFRDAPPPPATDPLTEPQTDSVTSPDPATDTAPGDSRSHLSPTRIAFLTRRPTRWSLLVPLVAILAGGLFAASGATSGGTTLRSAATGIPDLIREANRSNAAATGRLDALEMEVDALTEQAGKTDADLQKLYEQGNALAPDAARTPVIGPVVQVELNDAPLSASNIPQGFTVDDVVVHQQDVQAVVNALWAGGAEAMMLMDQRVISTSAIRCVGNTLILQGRVYSPPYVIQAMGDPIALKSALDADEKVAIYRQYVARLGLGYVVSTDQEQTFPGYAGSITPVFAQATS